MPVQIGAKAHNFTDPTGLLSDCHRRVEMFLGVLEAVARALENPPTEEVRRALEAALHYFEQAAPKHTADEEESLFPRLRRIQHPEVQAALVQLERLEEEHRWAAPLHRTVERLGERYLSMGGLSNPEVEEFRCVVASLASMYKQHIRFEDEVVFPWAVRTLSDVDKSAIADEMAGRRSVRMVKDPS